MASTRPVGRRAGMLAATALSLAAWAAAAQPADPPAREPDFLDLALEDLLDVEITTPSRRAQSVEDAPGIVTVISRQEIEGWDARNLGEILNRVASLVFISANVMTDNQVVVRKQSLTPYDTHVLILLDGRPLRDPIAGGLNNAVYAAFPVDAIESVEIVRGPGSVLYGSNAYAGVINIRTRQRLAEDDDTDADVALTPGAWAGFGKSAVLVARRGEASLLLAGGHYLDDGPPYRFTDYSGVDSSARWSRETNTILASVARGPWRGSMYYGDFDPYALNGPTNSWTPVRHYGAGRSVAAFGDAGWEGDLADGLAGTAHLTYNQHRWFNILEDFATESVVRASDWLGEATLRRMLPSGIDLMAGGAVVYSVFRSQLLIDGTETVWSAYAQADAPVGGRARVVAGAQYNKPQRTDGIVSPRLGLIVSPGRGFGGKLLYSQAFRSGSRLERSFEHPLFRGNEQLAPEIVNTWEAQISWRGGPFQAAACGYFSRMSDIIGRRWVDDPADLVYGGYLIHGNAGRHDFSGLELEWKAGLRRDLLCEGSLSLMRDETDEGLEDWTLHPGLMAKAGALWTQPWGSVGVWHSLFASLGSVRDFDPEVPSPNPDATDFGLLSAKVTIDAGRWLGMDPGERLRVSVWGENLLDEDVRYPEFTTRGINTLTPLRGGRALYARIGYGF